MTQVQGVVQQVSRRGKATNIRVDNQWYGCGFNGIPCAEGDMVSFTYTQNGQYMNADTNTMQVLQNGGGNGQQQAPQNQGNYQGQGNRGGGGNQSRAPSNNSGGNRSGGYRKDLSDPIQVSITQQSARNAAIQLVDTALKNDCCPLPTKKGDRLDALLDLVDTIEERFYNKTVTVAKAGGYPADASYGSQQAQQPHGNNPNDAPDDDIPF